MRSPNLNRDSSFLFLGNISVALLGLISGLILIHNLDIQNYGKWVLLLDISLTLGSIVDFGIPNVIVRRWNGDETTIGPFLKICQNLQRKILFVIFLFSSIFYFLSHNYHNLPITPWVFLLLGSSMNYLLGSYRMGLRLLGEAREESIALFIDRVIMIICLIIVTQISTNLLFFSIAYSISMFFSFLYSRWRFFSNLSTKQSQFDSSELPKPKELLLESFPFALTLLVIPMIGRIDKFVLAIFDGLEAVSIFNVAWLVILTGLLVPISIRQGAIAVLGNEINHGTNIKKIILDSRGIVSTLTLIGIPSSIVITYYSFDFLFPPDLISSDLYEVTGLNLVVFLLPAWVWAMLGCVELESLKLNNSAWMFSTILIIGLLFNIIFSFLLIPTYQTLGASISTSMSFFVIFILSTYFSGIYNSDKILFYRKFLFGISSTILLFSYGNVVAIGNIGYSTMPYFVGFMSTSILLLPDIIYLYKNNLKNIIRGTNKW